MTVAAALREAAQRLEGVSDTGRLDAELLMAAALGVSRSELLLRHCDAPVPDGFAEMLERRARHEPIAYITGEQEFYGRAFLVTPEVLIPRADSETLIAAALERAPPPARVLDLGTGSGCLLLTLLAEWPDAHGVGIDAALGALPVAAANAARLGVADRAEIVRRSWREAGWTSGLGSFDLVIANPPYVESGAMLAQDVAGYEPPAALFAGSEGLDDYRIVIPQLRGLLSRGGCAILEIGASQQESVGAIARAADFAVDCRFDLGGRSRALILT